LLAKAVEAARPMPSAAPVMTAILPDVKTFFVMDFSPEIKPAVQHAMQAGIVNNRWHCR
jgi:hypothetical protein